MFKNIDELIEVNLKLLYTSQSQFMMRINFKDEFGYNLKNTKEFSQILNNKGLVKLEPSQGFRCDLTNFGRQVFEDGGWNQYLLRVQSCAKFSTITDLNLEFKKIESSFFKKLMIIGAIVLVLCFFITLIVVQLLKEFLVF
ncbi:hypothetical protein FNW52_04190 [Flavobacterium sp. ZT3R18]|uniref:hypothetical protein n=1 Tax=Flavobacterium sp. ZT3R18 TaxID=2594429 RepID=UPI0011799BEF|nr:hypothetical protein [Flavobacterium sp. ZT3R18]TRX38109.1 hypothetical protein FNW52_04190 [Flavobacterium sp. ZT3R18]